MLEKKRLEVNPSKMVCSKEQGRSNGIVIRGR